MLLFDIIIPTYNNLEELKRCLLSFENQTLPSFKVWVAVDGSTDGTVAFLSEEQRYGFSLSCLQHSDKKNHGRAATRNLGLPHLTAEYVLFIDSDFVVKKDFLERHYELLQTGNVVSLGKIIYEKGNIWRDYDLSRGMNQFKKGHTELPAKYLVTDNVAIPAQVFVTLQGFDEQFVDYGGEDTELGCRIHSSQGFKLKYNKRAAVYGVMEKPLILALQQKENFARKNLKYLLSKHSWASDIFRIRFMQSIWAKCLYAFIPRKVLMSCSQNKNIPLSIRIKMVHLLVFCHLYKGYHQR